MQNLPNDTKHILLRNSHAVVGPVDVGIAIIASRSDAVGTNIGIFVIAHVAVAEDNICAGVVARRNLRRPTMRTADLIGGV